MSTEWIEKAQEFYEKHAGGVGSRGRILNNSDLALLQTSQFVCAYRPRGILSGFLMIHPDIPFAVYLYPPSSKLKAQRIRLRMNPCIHEKGMILSAYICNTPYKQNKKLVIEDLIYANGTNVWNSQGFIQRWKLLKTYMEHLCDDPYFQDFTISFTSYMSIKTASLAEPSNDSILEFVPCEPRGGLKRLIWVPTRSTAADAVTATENIYHAKRDISLNPDVYILYDTAGTKLGNALLRTLVVSKALREAFVSTPEYVPVYTQFNKQFDKWEIMGVAEKYRHTK